MYGKYDSMVLNCFQEDIEAPLVFKFWDTSGWFLFEF